MRHAKLTTGLSLLFLVSVTPLTLSCSSSASPAGANPKDGGTSSTPGKDSGSSSGGGVEGGSAGGITETGVMVDYESLAPQPGMTVTDNGVSTTTDSTGAYSLIVPATSTVLAPVITGPGYSTLQFPQAAPAGGFAQFGINATPSSSTFSLEQQILNNDQTMALVQIVVHLLGSCTSAVGGTLQVLSPAGASVTYFSKITNPDKTVTSFQQVNQARPVAVVYNVPVGSQFTFAVTHPTCKLVPFPVTDGGKTFNGQVTTAATEPGDKNSGIALFLQ